MNAIQDYTIDRQRRREDLLKHLKEAQHKFGYVSRGAIQEAARVFDFTVSEVYGITTFYSFLFTRPSGEYIIRICRSIPCYLQNAEMIIETVSNVIGIIPGQTTENGKFSFELTNCIGACDIAPAMLINDEVYGELTPSGITELLHGFG